MKKTQIMMMAIFILGGLVVPGASVAVAQEVGSESPEERGGYDLQRWLERMRIDPKLISDGGENNYLMSMPAWNQLVFESYHSGNWDIYTANKDGTDRVQLTTYPGTDIHPQFNRGCSRIVYASDMLGNFDIYSMQSDGSDVTLLTTVSQDDVNPQWSSDGSQIAFQSYRDGQAEIYVMKYDGSAQTRLTTNSSYDGQPSWSPDGSKIAFVSNRSGGYGIWVMNSNGSNPVQISNLAYGTSPVWSPDGARITFSADSNSDDWLELWVMNADGSNPRRIGDSYIVPGTDFIAESWSSDGTYVTTTTVKWMDVAGSGVYFWFSAKMEITNVDVNPYQGNLSGTYYLDWNAHMQTSDGIPPVTTVSALPSESPAVIGLQWSAVDDTSGVLSYDVQVRDGSGGQWVNVANGSTSIAMSYRGAAGHTYYFRVRARDKAYNAEPWNTDYDAVTTVESLPPSSEVEALPEFVRSGFSVRWNGEDAGGSEIKSYDIQYRTSTGSWQDWLVDTTTQSSKFYGNPGETYYFRSRAEDYGGVIESWQDAGDAHTTIYSWRMAGTVTDNMGAPIKGASVEVDAPAGERLITDQEGEFNFRVSDTDPSHSVSWSKTGWLGLPVTIYSSEEEALGNFTLPPTNNILTNWGFEDGTLGEYLAYGNPLPVVDIASRHTGQYGIQLSPVIQGFQSTQIPMRCIFAATDHQGITHIVGTQGNNDVYYYNRDAAGNWSQPTLIIQNLRLGPFIEMDTFGRLHIIYDVQDTYLHLYYIRRNQDGSWTNEGKIVEDGPGGSIQMSVDRRGKVHLVWDGYYMRQLVNGIWTTPSKDVSAFILGVDDNLEVRAGWVDYYGTNQTYTYYYRQTIGGVWGPIQILREGGYTDKLYKTAVDPNGQLHFLLYNNYHLIYFNSMGVNEEINLGAVAAWSFVVSKNGTVHVFYNTTGQGMFYIRRDPNGTWGTPETVLAFNYQRGDTPNIQLDSDSNPHLLFFNSGYDNGTIYYAHKETAGSWQVTTLATYPTDVPKIARMVWDHEGNLLLFWTLYDTESSWPINNFYAEISLLNSTQSAIAGISRQVTIPAEFPYPVLSFAYSMGGVSETGNTGLIVSVEDGKGQTVILDAHTDTNGWQQAGLDLSPWSGQTVTLRFDVQQAAGYPQVWVNLDEITLGSAYPDLWVETAAPWLGVLPGDTITLDLRYGNLGGMDASDVVLTLSLPAELEFLDASIPPTSMDPLLRWDIGLMEGLSGDNEITITVRVKDDVPLGTLVDVSGEITTITAETDTGNNNHTSSVFIGESTFIFIPFVLR